MVSVTFRSSLLRSSMKAPTILSTLPVRTARWLRLCVSPMYDPDLTLLLFTVVCDSQDYQNVSSSVVSNREVVRVLLYIQKFAAKLSRSRH